MSQLVECPFYDREFTGSIPVQVIPKTSKMALTALSPGAQHKESRARNQNWSALYVTGYNTISGLRSVIRKVRGYYKTTANFAFICGSFRQRVADIPKLFSSYVLTKPRWWPMQI